MVGYFVIKLAIVGGITYVAIGSTDNEDQLRTEIANLWVKVQEKAAACLPKEPPSEEKEKEKEKEIPPPTPPIPDLKDGAKNKDLKAFNGDWELITELFNVATDEPIIMYLHFDDKGVGNLTINSKKSKASCRGGASAKFDSESAFTVSMDRCNGKMDNSSYGSNVGACKLIPNTNKAKCMITCASGPCDATFQRRN